MFHYFNQKFRFPGEQGGSFTVNNKDAADAVSLHNRIRNELIYLLEIAENEEIRAEVKQATTLYTINDVDEILAEKLLLVETLLLKNMPPDKQIVLSFSEDLVLALQTLPPALEHPLYAAALHSLAEVYYYSDNIEKAIAACEQALAIRKKVVGEENLDVAESINNLAYLYEKSQQYENALPLFEQATTLYKKFLEKGHPDYINCLISLTTCLSNLASSYEKLGQYEEALALRERVIAYDKKTVGEEHPYYAIGLNNLAVVYEKMGHSEQALPLYEEAISIQKKTQGKEHPDYTISLNNLITCLNNKADSYEKMGQYEKSLPLRTQARTLFKEALGEEHPHYGISLSNLAILYQNLGQSELALPLYEQAIVIQKRTIGEEHPDYAIGLNNLAQLFAEMGKFEKVSPLYEQALTIRKGVFGEDHPDYITSLNNLAGSYEKMQQYEQALPLRKQATAISKRIVGEEHPDYAINLHNLAGSYEKMGRFEQALPLRIHATNIDKRIKGEEHPYYAGSLHILAELHRCMGRFEKALPLYEQAIIIYKKTRGEDHYDYASTVHNLALLFQQWGRFEQALPLYEQAIATYKKAVGEQHVDYANSLSNLAIFYQETGQYEKALPLYEQIESIYKITIGENNHVYANYLNNLGNFYEHMDQSAKAMSLFKQAESVYKVLQEEEHPQYAQLLKNLGALYQRIGQSEAALSSYEQAIAIDKKSIGEEHPDYATGLFKMGSLYRKRGQSEKALPIYEQAIFVYKKTLGEEHPDYTSSLISFAEFCHNMGLYEKALSLAKDASSFSLQYLTRTYTTLSEHEKMKLLKKEIYKLSSLPSFLVTMRIQPVSILQQVYINELALKGMILEDQKVVLSSIRKSGNSFALQLYEKWYANKIFLGKQSLLPLKERMANIKDLENETNQLEQQLSRFSTTFRQQQQLHQLTPEDITHRLFPGEAAVEFIRFRVFNKGWTDSTMYAALVLLPQNPIPQFILLCEEKELIGSIRYELEYLYDPEGKLNNNLYQLVWQPLEEHLRGVNAIYFAPAGLLHRISFQALCSGIEELLIDKYQLHQLFSTSSVAIPSDDKMEKFKSVSVWGDINYEYSPKKITPASSSTVKSVAESKGVDTTLSAFNLYTHDTIGNRGDVWKSIPGTKEEMQQICALLKDKGIEPVLVSGDQATKERFKSYNGNSPQVLHLPTHGFFLPIAEKKPEESFEFIGRGKEAFTMQQNPMFRSGLVLSGGNLTWLGDEKSEDGILTAYDIAHMDLSNTELVVLSACETGLGDIQGSEGVIGLQRAFKLAGVKQIIMSLWKVPDKQTSKLMILFYQNCLSGQSAREALRNAQLEMKKEYVHPYYWGAFVLVE